MSERDSRFRKVQMVNVHNCIEGAKFHTQAHDKKDDPKEKARHARSARQAMDSAEKTLDIARQETLEEIEKQRHKPGQS